MLTVFFYFTILNDINLFKIEPNNYFFDSIEVIFFLRF